VVEIPLGSGRHAYARLLEEPLVEFYDVEVRDGDDVNLAAILSAPAAFAIYVMNAATTSGRWRRVGRLPLTADDRNEPRRFCKQDALTGDLSISWEDSQSGEAHEVPASLAECERLEVAAVWSAEHVEDRLRDHFAGRPNKWVELLRPKNRGD
jgi:hypothetical protein